MSQPDIGFDQGDQAHEIAQLRRALKEVREQQDQERAERQHRIRNLLAVVRAISSRSLERAVSLEELAMHQSGRLSALARVEEALDHTRGGFANLEELLRDEWLVVLSASEEWRVEAEGPHVFLAPRAAERLGLALHELTTNALKFGALSSPAGRIRVAWTLDAETLEISWVETGVPFVDVSPKRTGFGRDLLVNGLAYDLQAETDLSFAPGGLRFTLRVPSRDNVVHAPFDAPPARSDDP